MALLRKRLSPIDRCMDELEGEIARVQKQTREIAVRAAHGLPIRAPLPVRATRQSSPMETMSGFVTQMLAPATQKLKPSYNTVPELFDGPVDLLKDIEAEPIA